MAEEIKSNLFSETTDSPSTFVSFDNMATQIPEERKYDFDLSGAFKEGYSEQDIAKFLSDEFNLDYDRLKTEVSIDPETGLSTEVYSDRDIINTLVKMRDVSPLEIISEGFQKGLAKGFPSTVAGTTGLRAGVSIGSRIHPIYGTLTGGGLGLIFGGGLGFKAGEEYIEPFFDKEGNIPIEYYGLRRGSEAFGEMVPFSFSPFLFDYKGLPPSVANYLDTLAAQSGKKIKKFFGSSIKFLDFTGKKAQATKKRKPFLFTGLELSSAAGASAASAIIEQITKTDDPFLQTTAELAGGVLLSPSTVLINSYNILRGVARKFTKEGRMTSIGKKLIERFQEFEELPDPSQFTDFEQIKKAQVEFDNKLNSIISDLELDENTDIDNLILEMGLPLVKKTSALKTNSRTIMALDQKYRDKEPYLDKTNVAYKNTLIKLHEILSRIDDPNALAEAAKLRESIARINIQNKIFAETSKAVEIADNFLGKNTNIDATDKAMTSAKIIYSRLINLKQQLRKEESRLYENINKNETINVTPIKETAIELFKDFDIKERDSLFDPTSRALLRKIVGETELTVMDRFNRLSKPVEKRITNLEKQIDIIETTYPNSKNKFENFVNERIVDENEIGELQLFIQALNDPKKIKGYEKFIKGLNFTEKKKLNLLAQNRIKVVLEEERLSNLNIKKEEELLAVSKETEEKFTVGELQAFKKRMYRFMMSSKDKNPEKTGIYTKLHQAVYDAYGLKTRELKGKENLSIGQQNLLDAFSFSRAFNDAFTRRYTGEILKRYDALNFKGTQPPELLAEQLFVNSPIKNKVRTENIKTAVDFFKSKLPEGQYAEDISDTMQGQLEVILQYLVLKEKIIDETVLNKIKNKEIDLSAAEPPNLINEEKLQKFMEEKGSQLKTISPSLFNDLNDLKKANLIFKNIFTKENVFSNASKEILELNVFLNDIDNPSSVIRTVVGTPQKRKKNALINFDNIAKRVAEGNEKTKNGFVQSLLQDASQYAIKTETGEFDFKKFKSYLKNPLQKGVETGDNVLDVIKNKNIISESQYRALSILLNEFEKIEKLSFDGKINSIEDAPSVLTTLYASIVGSGIGTKTAKILSKLPIIGRFIERGSGTGIIEAAAGAAASRKLFVGIPQTYFTNFVFEVMKNPKQMALVLRKAKNARDWFNLHKQFNGYLDSIGLSAVGESELTENLKNAIFPFIEKEIPPETIEAVPEKAAEAPVDRELKVASAPINLPVTNVANRLSSPINVANRLSSPINVATNEQARARFQQLFPMDIASRTMATTQQKPQTPINPVNKGIGTLFS